MVGGTTFCQLMCTLMMKTAVKQNVKKKGLWIPSLWLSQVNEWVKVVKHSDALMIICSQILHNVQSYSREDFWKWVRSANTTRLPCCSWLFLFFSLCFSLTPFFLCTISSPRKRLFFEQSLIRALLSGPNHPFLSATFWPLTLTWNTLNEAEFIST